MTIPELSDKGILPKGEHVSSLDEVRERFGGSNPDSKRAKLFKGLVEFIDLIKKHGMYSTIYVNGSFITDLEEPNDIDVVLELPPPSPEMLNELMYLSRQQDHFKDKYGIHVFATWQGSSSLPYDLTQFFQYVKPEEALARGLDPNDPNTKKGILRVDL